MELDYAFLADAADTNPSSGKFFVFNGGIYAISVPSLPAPVPTLALVIAIRLRPEEIPGRIRLKVTGEAPDGSDFLGTLDGEHPVEASRTRPPGREEHQIYVVNFRGLTLSQHGRHKIEIRLDGELSKVISFFCDPVGTAESRDTNQEIE